MKNLYSILLLASLLLVSCSESVELVSSAVLYDAAVLAVSVRVANESYDASATQTCGNSSHYGVENIHVRIMSASDARSEKNLKVVAAGLTSNRGSVVFKEMELGDYVVQATRADITIEKNVRIAQKKRIGVIMDF